MGWNSWNHFMCSINETIVKEVAQVMIDNGLQDLGYHYINLDDCWQLSRNTTTGRIQEDLSTFPSGMSALSDYVHSLDFSFGLYSDSGLRTCCGRPGGLGFEYEDAQTYRDWNIDYLKYDNCYNTQQDLKERYRRMRRALDDTNVTGLYLSLCEGGRGDPATWAASVGNSWRTTPDIRANWDSMTHNMDINNRWHSFAGPQTGWNDPDMLEVGNGKWAWAEQRVHFTMWCLMKAPLLLGNDVRTMAPEALEIVSNAEVIAWNQDPLGVQGSRRQTRRHSQRMVTARRDSLTTDDSTFERDDDLQVWAGPLSNNRISVVLLNRSEKTHTITADWKEIGIVNQNRTYRVRDVWQHQDLDIMFQNSISSTVPSHDLVAYELTLIPPEKELTTK